MKKNWIGQSNTNGEEMMWLSALLHLSFVQQVCQSTFHCTPPPIPENYHQLTFEARYVTVLVEVEQSGDPRSHANSEHHLHVHLYRQL